jgi:iron-sulfur cluster assembly enzyme ISCU, mitochondrial
MLSTFTRQLTRSVVRASQRATSLTVRAVACTQNTQARSYHENVLDHYDNPRNVGSLNKADKDVGTGLVGAPACGDVMKLQIKVNDESGVIEDAKFKTFGCGSAIASSSYATTWIQGKKIDEAVKIRNTDIASHLKLPPVKLHCSMLAEQAIKAAVADYTQKQSEKADAAAAQ